MLLTIKERNTLQMILDELTNRELQSTEDAFIKGMSKKLQRNMNFDKKELSSIVFVLTQILKEAHDQVDMSSFDIIVKIVNKGVYELERNKK
jgi:hypothetical protein